MAEEIQEAVQIIRVGYEGIEIAMKVCGGTLEEMKRAVDFLIAVMDHEKTMGKTDMRRLLVKGGDLQVFQFPTGDMKKVKKMAKKYGLLYSVLPDINKKDGMSEIIFHTEAVPRVNMMVQKLKFGRIAAFDDYLKNGDEKEIDKVLSFLKEQEKGNKSLHTEEAAKTGKALEELIEKVGSYAVEKKVIHVDEVKESFSLEREQAEHVVSHLERIGVLDKEKDGGYKVLMDKDAFQNRIRGYHELVRRTQTIAAAQNPNLTDITITRNLIAEENNRAIKMRIPGTWGEKARYIWIEKERVTEIHNGKTLLTFLDRDENYKIYSKDDWIVGTMKGEELYQKHYDRVSAEVLKRYRGTENKTVESGKKERTPKKTSKTHKR